ncbi:hypothetical protein K450DRAFT_254675 [Umbelopsis ramanniana AG]|uniref:Uncharacterized protein n=1 Tax=Umbelopsis ramanniana AG TaxID=1314678 RepID=A0AAD5HAA2_UMBRA|nr:uncharacterized protein K450DRAFT_254675 [Umbelopsis ramanniana AG]KAI8576870.1 hypothetical protein K450DRAFT_254675 [Umbelopsis ramanniana AG]
MSTNHNAIQSTTTYEKIASACTGAILTSILVTPMDVVKMRLQTQAMNAAAAQNYKSAKSFSSVCCMPADLKKVAGEVCKWNTIPRHERKRLSPTKLRAAAMHECSHGVLRLDAASRASRPSGGILDGVTNIIRQEGPTSLWRGLSPALVMSVPGNIIYFVGYDYLRNAIKDWTVYKQKDYAPLIAGGAARVVAVTAISPIELFRTRLQAAKGVDGFASVMNGVVKLVEKEGAKALWRGLPPTLWRDVPFSALYWMGYEEMKASLSTTGMSDFNQSFLAGASSGMFAAMVTTPFDVVKSRRQIDAGRDVPMFKDIRVPAMLRQIIQQEGYQGLFRGLTPRIAKVAPSCAIMISSYEVGKSFFAKSREQL